MKPKQEHFAFCCYSGRCICAEVSEEDTDIEEAPERESKTLDKQGASLKKLGDE
jgi:hypothetical protein